MYDPKIHHRRTIRIKDYDYSKSGMYFITICTKDKRHIFGNIIKGKMTLSKYGIIANEVLIKINENLSDKICIDSYVVMPNHVHFIVEFKLDNKISLKYFITTYKSTVRKRINKIGLTDVWQRNYYEHIIRNEKEMYAIMEYIMYNPINWNKDSLNF